MVLGQNKGGGTKNNAIGDPTAERRWVVRSPYWAVPHGLVWASWPPSGGSSAPAPCIPEKMILEKSQVL